MDASKNRLKAASLLKMAEAMKEASVNRQAKTRTLDDFMSELEEEQRSILDLVRDSLSDLATVTSSAEESYKSSEIPFDEHSVSVLTSSTHKENKSHGSHRDILEPLPNFRKTSSRPSNIQVPDFTIRHAKSESDKNNSDISVNRTQASLSLGPSLYSKIHSSHDPHNKPSASLSSATLPTFESISENYSEYQESPTFSIIKKASSTDSDDTIGKLRETAESSYSPSETPNQQQQHSTPRPTTPRPTTPQRSRSREWEFSVPLTPDLSRPPKAKLLLKKKGSPVKNLVSSQRDTFSNPPSPAPATTQLGYRQNQFGGKQADAKDLVSPQRGTFSNPSSPAPTVQLNYRQNQFGGNDDQGRAAPVPSATPSAIPQLSNGANEYLLKECYAAILSLKVSSESKYNMLESKYGELKESFSHLETQKQTLEDENNLKENFELKYQLLEVKNQELERTVEQLETKNKELLEQNKQAESRHEELLEAQRNLEAQNEELKEDLTDAEDNYLSIKEAYGELEARNEQLEMEVQLGETLDSRCQIVEGKCMELQEAFSDLENENDRLKDENQCLVSKCEIIERKYKDMVEANGNLSDRNMKLKVMNESLQAMQTSLEVSLKAARKEIKDMTSLKLKLESSNSDPWSPTRDSRQQVDKEGVELESEVGMFVSSGSSSYEDKEQKTHEFNKPEGLTYQTDLVNEVNPKGLTCQTNTDDEAKSEGLTCQTNAETESTSPTSGNSILLEGLSPSSESSFFDYRECKKREMCDSNVTRLIEIQQGIASQEDGEHDEAIEMQTSPPRKTDAESAATAEGRDVADVVVEEEQQEEPLQPFTQNVPYNPWGRQPPRKLPPLSPRFLPPSPRPPLAPSMNSPRRYTRHFGSPKNWQNSDPSDFVAEDDSASESSSTGKSVESNENLVMPNTRRSGRHSASSILEELFRETEPPREPEPPANKQFARRDVALADSDDPLSPERMPPDDAEYEVTYKNGTESRQTEADDRNDADAEREEGSTHSTPRHTNRLRTAPFMPHLRDEQNDERHKDPLSEKDGSAGPEKETREIPVTDSYGEESNSIITHSSTRTRDFLNGIPTRMLIAHRNKNKNREQDHHDSKSLVLKAPPVKKKNACGCFIPIEFESPTRSETDDEDEAQSAKEERAITARPNDTGLGCDPSCGLQEAISCKSPSTLARRHWTTYHVKKQNRQRNLIMGAISDNSSVASMNATHPTETNTTLHSPSSDGGSSTISSKVHSSKNLLRERRRHRQQHQQERQQENGTPTNSGGGSRNTPTNNGDDGGDTPTSQGGGSGGEGRERYSVVQTASSSGSDQSDKAILRPDKKITLRAGSGGSSVFPFA